MSCRWDDDDDESCIGVDDCAFAEYPRELVPYQCARLDDTDRFIRKVLGTIEQLP